MRRITALGLGGALVLAGCLNLDMFLFNSQSVDGYDFSESTVPADLIEDEIFLPTEDGGEIHAVWAGQPDPAPTVLYCHGNKWNLGYYWDRVEILHRLGANVLVFDYRGYGRSEGETTEEHTRADARAARRFLRDRGVPDEEVFYYGYSMGAAICLHLAVEDPPEALILESPWASVADIARSGAGLDLGPGWLSDSVFDNVETVRDLEVPLLLMHGVVDDFIPVDHGQRVFAAAPEPKDVLWVDGANHGDVPQVAGEAYDLRVTGVLAGTWFGERR